MGSVEEESQLLTSSKLKRIKMSVPSQNTTQPPPIVLTIPTQNDTNSEKEHILKLFPKRTILIFSIIQLVCAGLAGILQMCVIGIDQGRYYTYFPAVVGTGIWTGFFFGISGGIGLVAANRPSTASIIAFMVMIIISAIFALPLLVFAGIGFGGGRRSNDFSIVCYGVQIIVGLLQGVVAITASAFACRATCCGRKQNPGAVVFSQITNGEQTFATIPLNQIIQQSAQAAAPTVTPSSNFAANEEEKPPAYDTAAAQQPEDGDKYQRFN